MVDIFLSLYSGAEHKSVKFIFRNLDSLPDEIRKLSQLHQELLDIIFTKTQHGTSTLMSLGETGRGTSNINSPKSLLNQILHRKAHRTAFPLSTNTTTAAAAMHPPSFQGSQQELHSICDQVLQILRVSHIETRRSFLYKNEASLLIGQRVFLNLANHVLEFADYVPVRH